MTKPALAIATSVLIVAATIVPSSAAQAQTAMCNGVRATIVSEASVVVGTPGRDVIVVRGSASHTVKAGNGNDLICTSGGADTVFGGAGNDVVFAGSGADVVYGGAGNDVVNSGPGADRVFGGAGKDRIAAGSGADTLMGGASVDQLNGGSGQNVCASDPVDNITGQCLVDASSPLIQISSSTTEVTAGETLELSWQMSDPAGVAETYVYIGGPSGWVTDWCGFGAPGEGVPADLVNGNTQNGLYRFRCPVPQDAVNQTYTVFIRATDGFGLTQELTLDFAVVGGVADADPPSVLGGQVNQTSIRNGEVFDITFDVSDESGVDGTTAFLMYRGGGFADSTGLIYANWNGPAELVSGDSKMGTYRQQFVMNEYAPAGEYIVWVSVRDIYGNRHFVQTEIVFTLLGPIITG